MSRSPLVLASLLVAGCAHGDIRTNSPSISLFGFEESQVHHIHSNLDPERASGRVFLVRYDPRRPRDLEWVNCPIQVPYKYHVADAPRVEEMRIRSAAELNARLPLSVGHYGGYLEAGSELLFHYVTIGAFELAGVPELPRGDIDCSRATHYVTTLSVGAFAMSEERHGRGSISAGVGPAGATASAERESGEMTIHGDLAACLDGSQHIGCRTPLQLRLEPIPRRWWIDGDMSASTGGAATPSWPTPESLPATGLAIDRDTWQPGFFMARALERLLGWALEIDGRTRLGWDADASTIAGGYVTPGQRLSFTRTFTAGREYALFAASGDPSVDVDIAVLDERGKVVAADLEADGTPVIGLKPARSGQHTIVVQAASESFVALGIMIDGGFHVAPEILRGTFQDLLNAGMLASTSIAEAGYDGLRFHEGGLSLYGTILSPGAAINQRGLSLEPAATVFIGLAHGGRSDIDMLVESSSEKRWQDNDHAPVAVVVVEDPSQRDTYDYRMIHADGAGTALAASLVLVADGGAPPAAKPTPARTRTRRRTTTAAVDASGSKVRI